MGYPVIADVNSSYHYHPVGAVNVPLPPNIEAGDGLLVFGAINYQYSNFTFNDPGYSELYDVGDTYSTRGVIAYKMADGTEGASTSITASGSNDRSVRYSVLRFAAATIQPWDVVPPVVAKIIEEVSVPTFDPPLLSPGWGLVETKWLAGVQSSAVDRDWSTPSGYSVVASGDGFDGTDNHLITELDNKNTSENPGTSVSVDGWPGGWTGMAFTVGIQGLVSADGGFGVIPI